MLGDALAALIGLLLGLLINFLADTLPDYRADRVGRDEDEERFAPPFPALVGGANAPTTGILRSRGSSKLGLPISAHLFSPRSVIVNLLMAAICIFICRREGLTPSFFILIYYLAVFLLIAVIDIEHRLVLNVVMLPAFILALLETILGPRMRLLDALGGYAFGQLAVMAVYLLGAVYLWIINASRDEPISEVAFGFGDVTLAAYCGLLVGYPAVIFMLFLMIVLGGLFALFYLFYRRLVVKDYRAHMTFPYAPPIVLAASLMLLWGDRVVYYMLGGR